MTWEQLYANYWDYRSILSEAQGMGLTPDQAKNLVLQEQQRQQAEQQRQQAEQQRQREEQERVKGIEALSLKYPDYSQILDFAKSQGLSPTKANELIYKKTLEESKAAHLQKLEAAKQRERELNRQRAISSMMQRGQAAYSRPTESTRTISGPVELPPITRESAGIMPMQQPSEINNNFLRGKDRLGSPFLFYKQPSKPANQMQNYMNEFKPGGAQQFSQPQYKAFQEKYAGPSAAMAGGAQSAAARGFYQTPYSYQNI